MSTRASPDRALRLLLEIAPKILGFIVAAVSPADLRWPRILDALGISSAVRPTFNILSILLIFLATAIILTRYSRRPTRPSKQGTLLKLAGLSGVLSLVFFVLYFIGAGLLQQWMIYQCVIQFRQAAFTILATILALSPSSFVSACILLALHVHFSQEPTRKRSTR